MDFGFESNLIIFLMIALLVLLIYHKQIKSNVSDHNKNNEGYDNIKVISTLSLGDRLASKSKDFEGTLNDNDSNKVIILEIDDDNEYSEKHKKKRKHKNKKCSDHKYDMLSLLDQNLDMNELVNAMNKKPKHTKHNLKHSLKHSLNHHNGGHNKLQKCGSPVKRAVNTEFAEMQYHMDYNDVMTAINNLTSQKELFNMGFLPVAESEPNKGNVKSLVKLFLDKMNDEIKNNVQEYLHVNSGWNDMGKRRREKSGFEEQMEELGLPGSLYNEPASNAPINLIKVDKSVQFTTEDQIRFTIYIIVQKENVKDQMVLQVQFFMEREDLSGLRDDRANFFEKGLTNETDATHIDPNQVVIIEQVFILGYLTNETRPRTKMDKFNDYGDTQRIDGTIDQEKIIKRMLIKHKERETELNSFIHTLDDDAKEIYETTGVDSYSRYKNTRTIMDDLAHFPQRSFGDITI